ncbi:hypothetical protein IQ231_20015 [Cuspidothrix issatschenkoi LEGE 03284]|uniref:hypothetical protein n=1 Tax=Cuspidothrix issatschenkoi TaxID=230752 RepID=UPI00187F13AF|nr:hypothetical protein [Cuspidothrix issatschenkoi]MBE9233891.1 hypothetical protein [Cuspidothrix issatschenkoi LEGE 03284]
MIVSLKTAISPHIPKSDRTSPNPKSDRTPQTSKQRSHSQHPQQAIVLPTHS